MERHASATRAGTPGHSGCGGPVLLYNTAMGRGKDEANRVCGWVGVCPLQAGGGLDLAAEENPEPQLPRRMDNRIRGRDGRRRGTCGSLLMRF